MTQAAPIPQDILDGLAGNVPGGLLAALRAHGDVSARVDSLADSVERTAITDIARALIQAATLVHATDELGEPLPRARSRRAMAQTLAYANRFDEAIARLQEAVGLAEQACDPLEAARARMTTLHALARRGQLAEAVAAGELALRGFETAGERVLSARAHINLGVVHRMRDEPRLALVHFNVAMKSLDDQPVLLAQLQSNRAEALLDVHDFAGAEQAFESAMITFEAQGMTRAQAIVRGNIADLMGRQGRVEKALRFFEVARRLFNESDAPGDLARLWIEQAEVLLAIGMPDEAVQACHRALPTLRARGLTLETARALSTLARAHIETRQGTQARDAIAEAADIFSSLGHTTGQARMKSLLSRVASASDDHAGALCLALQAVELFGDRPVDAASARRDAAHELISLGRPAEAERQISLALAATETLGIAPLLADLLVLRARTHTDAGRLSEARRDLSSAVDQIERVRGALPEHRFRSAFLGSRAGVYSRAATASLDAPESDVEHAFTFVERAKGRSLQDLSHRDGQAVPVHVAHDSTEQNMFCELAQLRGELGALYGQTERTGTHESRVDAGWSTSVQERERRVRSLEDRLASTSQHRIIFGSPVGVSEIQGRLAPDSALVEYFEEAGRLSAFVISARSTVVHRKLADLSEVTAQVEAMAFQIERAVVRGLPEGPSGLRLSRDVQAVLQTLHRALLGPLAHELAAMRRVIFVPHGTLFRVPFHALVDPQGVAAVERFECVTAPSATVACAIPTRRAVTGTMLAVGVSDPAIPRAEHEAACIAQIVPAARSLLGANATVKQVLAAACGCSTIHFATHARFVRANPSASGIKLADGWLTAWDIAELRLAGAQVVLSGCDTGKSEVATGEEIMGLARALLTAGASSLLLSHWRLNDAVAEKMFAAMYTSKYHEGALPSVGWSAALRAAQLEFSRRGLHPAAWASLFEIGPV